MSRLHGVGTTLTALISGSMVLGGKLCGCAAAAGRWAWNTAATDPAATADKQETADEAARKRAMAKAKSRSRRRRKGGDDDQDEDQEPELTEEQIAAITAPPVAPVVRGRGDTWGILAIAALIGGATLYVAARTFGPGIAEALAPHGPLILCGGGLAWMVAAWMVSPPPPVAADEDEHQEFDAEDEFDSEDQEHDADAADDGDDAEEDLEDDDLEDDVAPDDGLSPGQRLQRHILGELAALETAHGGKGGLHVVTLIQSAEQAGLLSPGAMTKKQMRDWLETSKFPVAKSTRQPGGVPTPSPSDVDYGVKIVELAGVLGSSVSEAVRRMYGTPVAAPPPAPVQPPVPAPAEAPSGVPAGAVAGGVPGPRLRLVKPLSPDLSQGSSQDTA
ncbi:hypothetical protein [Streptomyces antimicrobicus]|uniref:Uncharacterized protein n=1 Tax=Streptomyces antimicrobicus TaxID=2883108 RepID=A0ABS8BDZ4_9ACTN|nr:hypothetical protein [Streptomyces antimicrobicus]MCB5182870.1 hypothetical protein [Streptomyces antimicrobicus]